MYCCFINYIRQPEPPCNANVFSDASAQLMKTTGKEWDIQNGLYWLDFGARLYDPVLGSFTTHDPLAEK